MSYGIEIRRLREEAGLSQQELADKVGVSRTAIGEWERESYKPTTGENLAALDRALGKEVGYFYSLIFSNPPASSGSTRNSA